MEDPERQDRPFHLAHRVAVDPVQQGRKLCYRAGAVDVGAAQRPGVDIVQNQKPGRMEMQSRPDAGRSGGAWLGRDRRDA